MSSEQKKITQISSQKTLNSIGLIEASLKRIKPYNHEHNYTPEELEPYDALSDRFTRAVEICLKFFRSYERLMFAENSDTLRTLLNRMEKLGFISSTELWLSMRELRNRIVHDYLPEDLKQIQDSIAEKFSVELFYLRSKIKDNEQLKGTLENVKS